MDEKPNFIHTPLPYCIPIVPNLFLAVTGCGFWLWFSVIFAFVMFWVVVIVKIYHHKDEKWQVSRFWQIVLGICYAAIFAIGLSGFFE